MFRLLSSTQDSFSLVLLLLLIFHLHMASGQLCNSVSCAAVSSPSCSACTTANTNCQTAWYNAPGTSCGTATGRSQQPPTRSLPPTAQCCPSQPYLSDTYSCQAAQYTTTVSGTVYDVVGYTCAKESRSGLGGGAMIGVVVGVAVVCLVGAMVGLRMWRRHLARAARLSMTPRSDEGSYSPPLLHAPQLPLQPYSTQPYNLSMQSQHTAAP